MKQLAAEMREEIAGNANLDEFARLLNEGWEMKRSLGNGISNPLIDEWYQAALAAGAQGGKLLGAGGGGPSHLRPLLDGHPSAGQEFDKLLIAGYSSKSLK